MCNSFKGNRRLWLSQGHRRGGFLGSFYFLTWIVVVLFCVTIINTVLFWLFVFYFTISSQVLLVKYIFWLRKKLLSTPPFLQQNSSKALSVLVCGSSVSFFTELGSLAFVPYQVTSRLLTPLLSSQLMAFSSIWHCWPLNLHWDSFLFGLQETTLFKFFFFLTGYSFSVSFLVSSLSSLLMWSTLNP